MTINNETASIVLEAVRSVNTFGPSVEGAFEEARCWEPHDQFLRSEFKNELRTWDMSPRRSRPCTFEFIKFIEFDSGNISHAAAYYEYRVTGPKQLIDELSAKMEAADDVGIGNPTKLREAVKDAKSERAG